MSLFSGKRLHIYEWVELSTDDDIISRVYDLATNENALNMIM